MRHLAASSPILELRPTRTRRYGIISCVASVVVVVAAAASFAATPAALPAERNEVGQEDATEGAGELEHFEEDEERIHQYWESALTPEEYDHALQATGMAAALAENGNQAVSRGGWFSTGPVGGIPNGGGQADHRFNGRIACIGTRSTQLGHYVYVGASSGGLWRAHSLDGTGVWTSLGDNLPNPSVRAFSIHPDDIDDILVGTGDLNRYGGSGMYRTTNGGGSWTQVTLPVSPTAFGRIFRSFTNPNLVVACCTSGGVLRSTDGGTTWTVALSGSVNDMAVDPTNFNLQYATKDNTGAFKSTDGGATWTNMDVPLPAGVPFSHGFVAVCRNFPENVGIFLSHSQFQVLRSTNRGASWTNITGPLGTPDNGEWHMNEFSHTGAITFRPTDPNEIFVGARGFQRSTNNGASWDEIFATHADITQLHFANQTGDDVLWVCNDGGIFAKTIGGGAVHWNGDASSGLRCHQVDFLDAERGLRAIGTQDNGAHFTVDWGTSWSFASGGDAWDCEIVDDLSNEFWFADGVYGGGPGIRVQRRRSGGITYTNNTAESMDGLFYSRFENMMYSIGADDLVYRSNVGGSPLSWTAVAQTPSQWSVGRTPTGSYVDGTTMYANVGGDPVVLIARLNGNWTVQSHDFGGSGTVRSIYASTENAGEAWVTMSRNFIFEPLIFHTRDHGATWTDATGNLTGLKNVRCLVQKPFEPRVLYVGTDIGVFETTDGGVNWTPIQTGLPIAICTDLRYVVDASHGGADRLVVATYGRGVYELDFPSFPIVYVHRLSPRTTENGTYDHPYDTFNEGRSAVPAHGSLGLYGDTYTVGPTLSAPMTLRAYGGVARITR